MSYVRIITTNPDRIEPATLPFEHVEVVAVADFTTAPPDTPISTGWPPIWIGALPDAGELEGIVRQTPGNTFTFGVTTPALLDEAEIGRAVDLAAELGMSVDIAVKFEY